MTDKLQVRKQGGDDEDGNRIVTGGKENRGSARLR